MKVIIVMDIEPEYEDSDHEMGVTSEGFEAIIEALMGIGDDIQVRRGSDDDGD